MTNSDIVGLAKRVRQLERVITVAAEALDIADEIIAVNLGVETPNEWHRAMRRVGNARARASTPPPQGV